MSYADRQQKGQLLCQKLAEAVAGIAPKGIGHWDRAWEIVDRPSVKFMLALTAWETNPSTDVAKAVSRAYDDLLSAWRVAADEYAAERSA